MLEDRFPQVWVPSGENRDLRQLLWHRHRMVQARTRIMNQLQAVALNEGLRCKKRLWWDAGREQLESFVLAPWGTTTTPFDMTVLNDLDRFHLAGDVIDRVPKLQRIGGHFKEFLRNKLIEHKQYIRERGEDMPEIQNWKWNY